MNLAEKAIQRLLGHCLFQSRVGPARFERRPTEHDSQEIMVGRRGEAPLVPPYGLTSFKKALALATLSSQVDFRADTLFSRDELESASSCRRAEK